VGNRTTLPLRTRDRIDFGMCGFCVSCMISMEFRVAPTRTGRRTAETSFRFGIEEEYFLCDAHTLEAMMRTPDDLFTDGHPHRGACLNREMLQAQIEVGTRPHVCLREARDDLIGLRIAAAEAAATHGFRIIAAGTHPTNRPQAGYGQIRSNPDAPWHPGPY
jgi:hypothetical protein